METGVQRPEITSPVSQLLCGRDGIQTFSSLHATVRISWENVTEERNRSMKVANCPSPNFLEEIHSLHLNVFQNIFLYVTFFKSLGNGWSRNCDSHLIIKKSQAWKVPDYWRHEAFPDSTVWLQPRHLSLWTKSYDSGAEKPSCIGSSNHMKLWALFYLELGSGRPGTLLYLGSRPWGDRNQLAGRSLPSSYILSRQDFTFAPSNPVILHCDPYKRDSWHPCPKWTAGEKVTGKVLLIDLEHLPPSKSGP